MRTTHPKFPYDENRKPTECLCPLCREIHILDIHWIGRGIPRKYCSNCTRNLNTYSEHPIVDFCKIRNNKKPMPEKQDRNINNWKTLM